MNLEEDYEAKYRNGWRPDDDGRGDFPVGSCYQMCSDDEMLERERQFRLHKYEVKPNTNPPQVDPKLAIKEFQRACVGREFARPSSLRPWSALKKTLYHLLLNICPKNDDWMFVCDFVFDRLKAVRQDMVIQRIEGKRYIEVLEGSIRFLVYSMYRITCTLKDYSQNLPQKPIIPMQGQVKGLTNREMQIISEMKLTMQCLRDCLRSLIIQYETYYPDSHYRPLFESVNIIVNLPFLHGAGNCVTKYWSNKNLRDSDPTFKTVFKMYLEHLSNNHWSALKRLPDLVDQPLIVLAYAPVLAQIQLDMMKRIKTYCATPAPNTASLEALCSLICPKWLEIDEYEKINFTKLLAIQFEVYDHDRNLCDFRKTKKGFVFSESVAPPGISDTSAYALQMIAGKDWFLIHEIVQLHEITTILNPNQP